MNNHFLSFVVLVLSITSFNCVAVKMDIEKMQKKKDSCGAVLYFTGEENKYCAPEDPEKADNDIWDLIEIHCKFCEKSIGGELHVYDPKSWLKVCQSLCNKKDDLLKEAEKIGIHNRLKASFENLILVTERSMKEIELSLSKNLWMYLAKKCASMNDM